jgi:hypothetical protein
MSNKKILLSFIKGNALIPQSALGFSITILGELLNDKKKANNILKDYFLSNLLDNDIHFFGESMTKLHRGFKIRYSHEMYHNENEISVSNNRMRDMWELGKAGVSHLCISYIDSIRPAMNKIPQDDMNLIQNTIPDFSITEFSKKTISDLEFEKIKEVILNMQSCIRDKEFILLSIKYKKNLFMGYSESVAKKRSNGASKIDALSIEMKEIYNFFLNRLSMRYEKSVIENMLYPLV